MIMKINKQIKICNKIKILNFIEMKFVNMPTENSVLLNMLNFKALW